MEQIQHPLATTRRSGVLLHLSSLPGGNLGKNAYRFVDFLAASGFSVWQMLPICPVDGSGSPYNGGSAFAGNPAFIDKSAWDAVIIGDDQTVVDDYDYWNQALLNFRERLPDIHSVFTQFIEQHSFWLKDFALYTLLKKEFSGSWVSWPDSYRSRNAEAMAAFAETHQLQIEAIYFQQFEFFHQWSALKRYANDRGVLIVGDMPIFVAHDSADCWAHQSLFLLDATGEPEFVAGVPPDYFSETGQRWGNPQYDWEAMSASDFVWWLQRFRFCFNCFDLIRVDHFRGFEACWFIPAAEDLAINGYWQKVPGEQLFKRVLDELGELPIIAEDLGVITPEVEQLRDEFELPGMKILQFAFDGSSNNPYLPENHIVNSVIYTGTHDNDTIQGWFVSLSSSDRERVLKALAGEEKQMPWLMIKTALQSVANTVVIPMQDLLSLGNEARMNKPGTVEKNWQWRFDWEQVTDNVVVDARNLNQLSQRML